MVGGGRAFAQNTMDRVLPRTNPRLQLDVTCKRHRMATFSSPNENSLVLPIVFGANQQSHGRSYAFWAEGVTVLTPQVWHHRHVR